MVQAAGTFVDIKSKSTSAVEHYTNGSNSNSACIRGWTKICLRLFCTGLCLTAYLVSFYGSRYLFALVGGKSVNVYAVCSNPFDGNNIYTVDLSNSRVQCILIRDNIIADTGDFGLLEFSNKEVPVHILPQGSIVMPGISESHAHTLSYGLFRQIPLEEGGNIPGVVASVREYILSNPDIAHNNSKVVEGWGWDRTAWPERRWPTAADLDADPAIRGRHVMLRSKDGHATWVSSTTLQAHAPYPDKVEGGDIIRDEFGEPVGVFLDNAQALIPPPVLTDEDLAKRFSYTARDALANGITSIHDMKLNVRELGFFKRQADAGKLQVRMHGMHFFEESEEYWGNTTDVIVDVGNGRWTARGVKIVADGSLRAGSAALYEPYYDNPESSGFMRVPIEVLNKIIPLYLRDGWQIASFFSVVHGIGDRANGYVLDALEKSFKDVDVTATRPRLEHAQIMTDDDIVRLGKLGFIASIQPSHVMDDMWYAEDRLGPERVRELYAFRKIINGGAKISLGSDFPVADINPLATFYAALTRLTVDGRSPHGPGGYFPDQVLTRVEALRGMTIDPAYASFTETTLGSLELGKRADFVVLSQDIMQIPVDSILATYVVATAIDGLVVYGSL
ncbi:hypothetical protein FISHEDRAFT_46144 [Fistulina hepatica ATCC 64428]|uniref:Amidohydrolase 3 domain-containing protein n=1 Tax=Fistulina hepatica ATCC 64428 TaxID=1128425 RepID=A0A0D7AAP6_9AGAR|nr:hypothetical protein FISHEDRAFT_46144 [Fistulina hepatica ATCC 64428]